MEEKKTLGGNRTPKQFEEVRVAMPYKALKPFKFDDSDKSIEQLLKYYSDDEILRHYENLSKLDACIFVIELVRFSRNLMNPKKR